MALGDSNVRQQMALGDSNVYLKESLLLRATFRVLAGLPDKAESDISKLMGIRDLPLKVGVTSSACSASENYFELILFS